jgi:hypothetical protein
MVGKKPATDDQSKSRKHKQDSLRVARQLFNVPLPLAKDEARAEALLIARFVQQWMKL